MMSAEAVSVAALQKAFEDNGWSVDKSFSREDLATLQGVLGVRETDVHTTADNISHLVALIHERSTAAEFPLLRPTDLAGEGDQKDAEHALKLTEKCDVVKLQSYIVEEKRRHFESVHGNPTIPSPAKAKRSKNFEQNFEPATDGFSFLAASIWLLLTVQLHDGFRLLAAGCQLLALAPACSATAA